MRRITSASIAAAGLVVGSLVVATPAVQAADPLSGTIDSAGHKMSWA